MTLVAMETTQKQATFFIFVLGPILSLLLSVVFQFLIMVSIISLRKQNNTIFREIDRKIWNKMFKSIISLFGVLMAEIIGMTSLAFSVLIQEPSLIAVRLTFVYFIFASSALNPLIVVLGNVPVRNAALRKKKLPTWLVR